ncbi:MAG TPA: hypothetical protein VGE35_04390 [Candidatus Paceibacterota bacterium]
MPTPPKDPTKEDPTLPRILLGDDPQKDSPEQAKERLRVQQAVADRDRKLKEQELEKQNAEKKKASPIQITVALLLILILAGVVYIIIGMGKQPEKVAIRTAEVVTSSVSAAITKDGDETRKLVTIDGQATRTHMTTAANGIAAAAAQNASQLKADYAAELKGLLSSLGLKELKETADATKAAVEANGKAIAALPGTIAGQQSDAANAEAQKRADAIAAKQKADRDAEAKRLADEAEAKAKAEEAKKQPAGEKVSPPPSNSLSSRIPAHSNRAGRILGTSKPAPTQVVLEPYKTLKQYELSEKFDIGLIESAKVFPSNTPGIIAKCYQGVGTGDAVEVPVPADGNYELAPNTRKVQFYCATGPMAVYKQ